jgi:hypothetical protein
MEMATGMGLTCTNCGDGYFFIVYSLFLGHDDQETRLELLRCMTCGELRNERFETIREN